MARLISQCSLCKKELRNGTDTFGSIAQPFCWDCYALTRNETTIEDAWTGLAPHHHDESITGTLVGSTVFDPLPAPNERGEYEVDGFIYVPVEPNYGIWRNKPLIGWK